MSTSPLTNAVHVVRRVLRERRSIVVGVVLLFMAIALLYETRTSEIYHSVATVQLQPGRPEVIGALGIRPSTAVKSDVAAQLAKYATDRDVLVRAREILDDPSLPPLTPRTTAGGGGLAGVVRIAVVDIDPERGARGANAVAQAFVEFLHDRERRTIDELLGRIQDQLDGVRAQPPSDNVFLRLLNDLDEQRLIDLRTRVRLVRGISDPARIGSHALARKQSLLAANKFPTLMFSFGLALALALLLDAADRRPRAAGAVAAAAGTPLRAVVPRPRRRLRGRDRAADVSAAALERLIAALQAEQGRPPVVHLSNVTWDAGGPAVADGLVAAARRRGHEAIVVGRGDGPSVEDLRAGAVTADVVVVDGPPALVGTDAQTASQVAGCSLLVTRAGRATAPDLDAAAAVLRAAGNLVGIVVTGADARDASVIEVVAPASRPAGDAPVEVPA